MVLLAGITSGILGLIVGSFLNVIILRTNTGMGIGGRSQCFSCRHQLAWYELLPVVSYVFQKGKCRSCRSRISLQYPIVEAVTGLLFVLPVIAFPLVDYHSMYAISIAWVVAAVGMVVAVYDIRHQMIPVSGLVVLGAIGLVLMILPSLYALSLGLYLPVPILERLIAGVVVPAPFFLVWLFSRGKKFGLGDVELMVPMGLSLGIVGGVVALLIAFWSATLVVGGMIVVRSQLLRARKGGILQQAIPFGPFLLGAWYILLVFGQHVLAAITRFVGI